MAHNPLRKVSGRHPGNRRDRELRTATINIIRTIKSPKTTICNEGLGDSVYVKRIELSLKRWHDLFGEALQLFQNHRLRRTDNLLYVYRF